MNYEIIEEGANPTNVKVIGVGGAGGNAIDRMIQVGIHGVEYIAANTDLQDLEKKQAHIKVQLGPKITKGYGAGAQWEMGEKAALESKDEITEILRGTDLLFITAGMGGGTGTGASPVIARLAKELNILTVGVVTKPFIFEGKPRMRASEGGISKLIDNVDSLIVIKNENLLKVATKQLTFDKSFEMANNILRYAVQGIAELLTKPGLINLDFADLKTVMNKKGKAVMSIGIGSGDNRAIDAVENAISSPLLEEDSIEGAMSLILNISGGKDLTLTEVNQIVHTIAKEVDENANIIFGHTYDMDMNEEVRITLVATGFSAIASSSVSEKSKFPVKMELLAGKEFEKPAFQRVLKNQFSNSKMGSDDKIVKEINPLNKEESHVPSQPLSDIPTESEHSDAPQFLINWDNENYDIPAFLRQKSK